MHSTAIFAGGTGGEEGTVDTLAGRQRLEFQILNQDADSNAFLASLTLARKLRLRWKRAFLSFLQPCGYTDQFLLVRISIGLEGSEDLKADLTKGLRKVASGEN